ncbi:MAG: ATP-binding protein [Calditrichaeota bacterium]|nr:MAG: ATP-binding protein [Calditrichota bacterium]
MEKLAPYIADNCGAIVSAKKIADFLKSQRVKITPNVVLNYLSHLKSSFLIDKVSRSDIAGKKIFEVSEKYYWEDIGIRNTIKPYKLGDINKILENIVYHHLRVHDFRVLTGQLPGKKEIDFIAERREKKLYIQVTYLIQNEQTFGREFGNLLQIKDNFPKYVVSMDPVSQSNHQGVIHLHLRDFLLMDFQD